METAIPRKRVIVILIVIVAVAAFVRVFRITSVDVTTDEALIGFRSIGYLDFLSAPTQKTPPEWYDPEPAPSWTKLSFHDHPPLTFLLQHLSFKIFGENHVGLRMPFVLAGIGSVWLIYLIGRRLFGDETGLAAAGILAISAGHGVISRIGLQESLAIFFVLLQLYFFLRALTTPSLASDGAKWFLAIGAAVGGGLLVKYTSAFLLPAFFLYILLWRPDTFRRTWLWAGAGISLVLFSPVIIYNILLFQARGHFDLQFAYLLHQKTPEWTYLLGKIQIGSFADRIGRFPVRLLEVFSVPNLSFSILSLVWFLVRRTRQGLFLLFTFFFLTALLLVIGPQQRFLTMYAPFFALSIAAAGTDIWRRMTRPVLTIGLGIIASLWLLYEGYFFRNTVLTFDVPGKIVRDFARVKFESFSWGYSALNDFLDERLTSRRPAFILQPKFRFVERRVNEELKEAEAAGLEPEPLLIIMDENVWNLAGLWTFTRRGIYHGWPIVVSADFIQRGAGYYHQRGLTKFLFVRAAAGTLQESTRSNAPEIVERRFMEQGIKPAKEISDPRGEVAFRIYEL